jgi:hypothetical protein
MSKLLYYLAAFGSPNVDSKCNILCHNINYIHASINSNFDLFVNVYDDNFSFETFINKHKFPFLNNIIIYRKKGILSELWVDNPYHNRLSNYDNILFILDDIKIIKLNMGTLINIKTQHNIEFLSPAVRKATWSYMKPTKTNSLVLTHRLEIFCLLLKYTDFMKFMNLTSIDNPNMWGVDYMMSHYKIKCAIYNDCVVEHMFKSASDHQCAINQMNIYFKQHGFNSREDFLLKYPNDLDCIIQNI